MTTTIRSTTSTRTLATPTSRAGLGLHRPRRRRHPRARDRPTLATSDWGACLGSAASDPETGVSLIASHLTPTAIVE